MKLMPQQFDFCLSGSEGDAAVQVCCVHVSSLLSSLVGGKLFWYRWKGGRKKDPR